MALRASQRYEDASGWLAGTITAIAADYLILLGGLRSASTIEEFRVAWTRLQQLGKPLSLLPADPTLNGRERYRPNQAAFGGS